MTALAWTFQCSAGSTDDRAGVLQRGAAPAPGRCHPGPLRVMRPARQGHHMSEFWGWIAVIAAMPIFGLLLPWLIVQAFA